MPRGTPDAVLLGMPSPPMSFGKTPSEAPGSTFHVALERAKSSGRPLLDLTESDPARCGLAPDSAEIQALLVGPAADTAGPAPDGLEAARDAVASYLAGRGASVPPERIHFTTSRAASHHALLTATCYPDGEVLAASTRDPLIDSSAAAASVRVGRYAIGYDGEWRLDRRSLKKAVTPRTRAILVGNPSEPTGAMLRSEDLGFLEDLCAARGIVLIGDETLADTARDSCACVLAATRCVSFHVSGLSGVCGLAGLGAEWWAVAGPDELVGSVLSRLGPAKGVDVSVPTAAQLAIPALLARRGQFLARLRGRLAGNRAALALAAVRESPWSLLWGRGGCWAVLEIGAAEQDERLCLALLDDGVAVQPGSLYGLPTSGHLVISLLPPPEIFGEALSRLDRRLRSPFFR